MCSKDTSLFLHHNAWKIKSCILTISRLPHVRNPQHWDNKTCSTYPMGIMLHVSSTMCSKKRHSGDFPWIVHTAPKCPGESRNIVVCSCVILISLMCANIDNNIRHISLIELSSCIVDVMQQSDTQNMQQQLIDSCSINIRWSCITLSPLICINIFIWISVFFFTAS